MLKLSEKRGCFYKTFLFSYHVSLEDFGVFTSMLETRTVGCIFSHEHHVL